MIAPQGIIFEAKLHKDIASAKIKQLMRMPRYEKRKVAPTAVAYVPQTI